MNNLNEFFFSKMIKKDTNNFLSSNILRNLRLFCKKVHYLTNTIKI